MSAPRPSAAQPSSTVLSVSEGGIPPPVQYAIQIVAGDEATQSQPSTAIARDARIATVPLEESVAIPDARPVQNPPYWPSDVRGVPNYRPQEEVDFSTRPMGQNTGEFIFLTLMLSGVQAIGYANTAWRQTFGRVTDKVWRYAPGGSY